MPELPTSAQVSGSLSFVMDLGDELIAEAITVLVADDHELVRRGVVDIIEAEPDLKVVAEASCSIETLQRVAAVRPHVVVTELVLPDGTGLDVVRQLTREHPETACAVLTDVDDDTAVEECLAAGAAAFLVKSARSSELVDVVRSLGHGRRLLSEQTVARRRAAHPDPTDLLTPTERKVLDLIAEGLSNREIGTTLGLAEKTVKNHVTGLLAKLHFRRRTQVAAWVAGRRQHESWRRV